MTKSMRELSSSDEQCQLAAIIYTHHWHFLLLSLKADIHFTIPQMAQDWVNLAMIIISNSDTIFPDGRLRLQQGSKADVVLGHDTVDHVVWSFCGLNCQLIELHQILGHQTEPAKQQNSTTYSTLMSNAMIIHRTWCIRKYTNWQFMLSVSTHYADSTPLLFLLTVRNCECELCNIVT